MSERAFLDDDQSKAAEKGSRARRKYVHVLSFVTIHVHNRRVRSETAFIFKAISSTIGMFDAIRHFCTRMLGKMEKVGLVICQNSKFGIFHTCTKFHE